MFENSVEEIPNLNEGIHVNDDLALLLIDCHVVGLLKHGEC